MSGHILKNWTPQECAAGCNARLQSCKTFNSGNPNPARAMILRQCYTQQKNCINSCP